MSNLSEAEAYFNLGNQLYRQNQLDRAVESYRQAIALQPDMAKAHGNLGLVLSRQGKLAASANSYARATELEPHNIDIQYNLGVVLLQQNEIHKAEQRFRKVLQLAPEHTNASITLGNILIRQNNLNEALDIYRKLVETNPTLTNVRYNLANLLLQQGDLDAAAEYLRSILLIDPNYAGCYFSLGNISIAQNRIDEAIANYRRAVQLDPKEPLTHFLLGNALAQQGKSSEAITSYQNAIRLHPKYVDAYYNLGIVLRRMERFNDAIDAYKSIVQIAPDRAEIFYSLGNIYLDLDRYEEAIASYQSAIEIDPNFAQAFNSLGTVYRQQHKLKEAIASIERAVALQPDYADARFNLGSTLLLAGDMQRGFAGFEHRLKIGNFARMYRSFHKPQWDGSPLDGKTILLYSDAALGDTIQAIRYIPQIAAQRGRIILRSQAGFKRLLQNFSGIDRCVAEGEDLPEFDVFAPLLSLPYILNTTLETIPNRVPYIFPIDEDKYKNEYKIYPTPNSIRKVGIVWSSGFRDESYELKKFYRTKTCDLSLFERIVSVPNTYFYSLQVGQDADDIKLFSDRPHVFDLSSKIRDFADTANAIAQLDLVISVDTSVAHLAGAMAKPVWGLIPFAPDWRWMLQREDTPWYPTMRLFRQKNPGDWAEVLGRVYDSLMHIDIDRSDR